MNATTVEWFKKYGRHPIFANKKDVPLPEYADPLTLKVDGGASLLHIEPLFEKEQMEDAPAMAAGGGGGGQ